MVEIALAILVFSLGVLAVFALFTRGIDQKAKAVTDTRRALFANNVFNGLRAKSTEISATALSNEWEVFWAGIIDGTTNISVACGTTNGVWVNDMRIYGDNKIYTNIFTNFALHARVNTNIVSHTLRYKLEIKLQDSSSQRTNAWARAVLRVWEGEFGATNDNGAVLMYTEYDNPGNL